MVLVCIEQIELCLVEFSVNSTHSILMECLDPTQIPDGYRLYRVELSDPAAIPSTNADSL